MILKSLLCLSLLSLMACQRGGNDGEMREATYRDSARGKSAVQCQSAHGETTESRNGIVNGKEISIQDPLTAKLVLIRLKVGVATGHCTGSLLPQGIILTASHCIVGELSDMEVVLPSATKCGGEVRSVRAVLIHPQKKNTDGSTNRLHDLALIRFAGSLPVGYQSMTLANPDLILDPDEDLTMVGYGVTSFERYDSGILRIVNQRAANLTKDPHSSAYQVEQSTGGVCRGDSGGPLVVYRNSAPVVIGVASAVRNPDSLKASERCESQSIYTPIDQNRDWIRKAHAQLLSLRAQP